VDWKAEYYNSIIMSNQLSKLKRYNQNDSSCRP